ncbi:uncharacterized protein LOC134253036 [Saccostrea cucullata]|uniref:uncharacterized protein LOC134253036 n=1 Tax=Saccostrea cuccullata TaxID=36930 RepID=UPI002ED4DC34
MKTSHCSEIEKLVSCHISHVEKTYEIECVDSWMMRRAIVSSLVEHNVITEQLRLKCFPSPCAAENSLKLAKSGSYTGLLPHSQQIFCWSVIRLVNNGIAAITDTNKSTCYTSDKRRFLSAIQTKLEGMWDKTKFHISECPLTITYDKTEGEIEITRSTTKKIETFILTNLHYVIGGIAGVLLILVFVLVGRLKFKSNRIPKDKKELPNRRSYLNRQSHVYHEIGELDQSLKMPYEIEEKEEGDGHSYVTLQQKESGPNETPTMVDASNNRLSVLYINTAHSE